VLRPGQPFDHAATDRLLLEPLAEALAADGVRIAIHAPALPLANPYADDATLVLADLQLLPGDRFRARVTIRTGDSAPMPLVLDGAATVLVRIPVPATTLPVGHTVSDGDLETTLQPVERVREDWLLDEAALVGLETRRPLAAGRPVTETAIGEPYLVRRGDVVALVYRRGGLTLETPARAEADGTIGDRIEARNVASGARVVATVVAPATLLMEPGR
jgi:flagella basal body P-ring formation protein FlgA